jgi:F420-0:gamma-glutamyl ligase-like protein
MYAPLLTGVLATWARIAMIVGSTKLVAIVSGEMIQEAKCAPGVIADWLRNA